MKKTAKTQKTRKVAKAATTAKASTKARVASPKKAAKPKLKSQSRASAGKAKVKKGASKKAIAKTSSKASTQKIAGKKIALAKSKANSSKTKSTKKVASPSLPKVPRIGIFGGTFNPFHNGHANSIVSVKEALKLEKVLVIPSYQNPLKSPIEGPTAEQRLEMVKLGVMGLGEGIDVLDIEIEREGMSYTFETLLNLKKAHKGSEFCLIVGADTLADFHKWKNYAGILDMTDLAVTSRPGHSVPRTKEEFPEGIRDLIKEVNESSATLWTGREIFFVDLADVDVSATDLRKQARLGVDAADQMPSAVWNYIQENGLYRQLTYKISDFSEFTRFCGRILFTQKGIAVKGYDLRDLEAPTEFTLIASGTSTRHSSAIAENLVRQVKLNYGVLPLSSEGLVEGRWVVLDYGALIIHVFYDYVRQEYRLEDLWRRGRDMELKDPTGPTQNVSRVAVPSANLNANQAAQPPRGFKP